jgi:hypothetical protein
MALSRPLACVVMCVAMSPAIAHATEPDAPLAPLPKGYVLEEPRFKVMAIEGNVLAATVGRFSVNVEYVFSRHHAAIVSPHFFYSAPGTKEEIDGGGAEIGYRFYSGDNGPEGVFVGASVLAGQYRYNTVETTIAPSPIAAGTNGCAALTSPGLTCDSKYNSYGLAVDAGYQLLLHEHFVLSGGIGAQYNYFTNEPTYRESSGIGAKDLFGPGFRPRILVAIGGAF